MDSLLQGAGMLMSALGITLTNPVGSSVELDAERERWLEMSSRDSILADFTKCILHCRPDGRRTVFTSEEAANLERVFATHTNEDNCWDQKSLESYLSTQIPSDEKYQALLINSAPSLWKLITYFVQWPFTTTPSPGKTFTSTPRLQFDDLVRAVAFLCGRHSIMFSHFDDARDADVPRREDRLVLEHMFRALANDASQETTMPTSSSSRRSRSLLDDVLDILNTVQPALNEFTIPMHREQLLPLAHRLLPPHETPAPAALTSLSVSTTGPDGILALLDLFVPLLQHTSKFDTVAVTGLSLGNELQTARTKLQNANSISFNTFLELLDAGEYNLNIYDAMALLFNTFPNPKSLTNGVMIQRDLGGVMGLSVLALRRGGVTVASS